LSKSATALQQQIQPRFDEFDAQAAKADGAAPAWKQEVNQRLAAHRNRKPESQEANARANNAVRPATGRAAEAAARVAARYAKAPSYQQVLAGAGAAVRAAGAAAEAARSAHVAAQAVLAGLESEMGSQNTAWQGKPAEASQSQKTTSAPRWQDQPPAQAVVEQESARLTPWSGTQSRWEDAVPVVEVAPEADVWADMRVQPDPELDFRREEQHHYRRGGEPVENELFRDEHFDEFQTEDPLSRATVEPIQHLPANLIEFPRELVATRKARPRRAEGPLYDPAHEDPQLNIFDAEPQIAAPVIVTAAETVAPPEWASIELDHPEFARHEAASVETHHPGYIYTRTPELSPAYEASMGAAAVAVEELPLQPQKAIRATNSVARESRIRNEVVAAPELELMVANWSDRLLALIVDGALVTLAFLAAAMVVVSATAHPPAGQFALIASICGWVVFSMVYQTLFLSYAEEGTPGMRYARIALCTFEDENPTPAQMRKRIPTMLVSTLPGGLGLFWALLDKDHLTWHDRMTKTYQRKY
jgi:uncharacterized RDD family membrane protein YckC